MHILLANVANEDYSRTYLLLVTSLMITYIPSKIILLENRTNNSACTWRWRDGRPRRHAAGESVSGVVVVLTYILFSRESHFYSGPNLNINTWRHTPTLLHIIFGYILAKFKILSYTTYYHYRCNRFTRKKISFIRPFIHRTRRLRQSTANVV